MGCDQSAQPQGFHSRGHDECIVVQLENGSRFGVDLEIPELGARDQVGLVAVQELGRAECVLILWENGSYHS